MHANRGDQTEEKLILKDAETKRSVLEMLHKSFEKKIVELQAEQKKNLEDIHSDREKS